MTSLTIHSRLTLLVLATALPLTLFAVGLVLWQSRAQKDSLREDASRTAAVAMQVVDRELSGAISGLQVLAVSPSIAQQDFKTFHAQAISAVGVAGNSVIVLYDRAGNRIVSTAAPFGEPLPRRRDMSVLAAPFDTGQPFVTRLFVSESVKLPTVGVVVPVLVAGKVRYVLGAGILSQRLSELVANSGLPHDWVAAVLDQQGSIIARTTNPERFVGESARPEVWKHIQEMKGSSGTFEGDTKEGKAALLSFTRSGNSGWTTVVAFPNSVLEGPLHKSLAAVAMATSFVVLLALLLAWWAARRISLPALRLREVAKSLEEGRVARLPPLGIDEFDKLAVSMEHAGQKIGEREVLLKESFEQLQVAHAKLRGEQLKKDQFIATLSHELRNPLAPIRNGVQVLAKSPTAQAASKTLAMMERQLSHLVRLIDDLLDVSRIARGKLVLQKEEVVLQKVISDATEALEPAVIAAGQELILQLPAHHVMVSADADRLVQVLTNVLNNASKFSARGASITLSMTERSGEAEICVSDQGIGIAPGNLGEIFEPFVQIDDAEHAARKAGLGIGLSLSKLLVELHGGTIEARSEGPGCGATVVIRLPGSRTSDENPGVPLDSPEGKAVLRVLVVDDNKDAAEMLTLGLSMSGHRAEAANNGATALQLATGSEFDVFVLDIGMPDMDGYELCRRLRQDPKYRQVKIIALTGWGAESDRQKSKAAGFDVHLTKPVDLDAIEQILEESRAGDEP